MGAFTYSGDARSVYNYPPFALIGKVMHELVPKFGRIVYLHHKFDGANYMTSCLTANFDARILIGVRKHPVVMTPAKKFGADGYYRPYSEPKTYLYFKGFSVLSLVYFCRTLISDRCVDPCSVLQYWAQRSRHPSNFTVQRL